MRLHTLRLEGVGPFADPQEIDFDRLGAGGLFLFEGPTGVGKTTIIDALTFALYGGLASDAGDTARMRSDFVDPEVRPQVELEFSVRGERHRITRSPEYLRPKRRGTGMTREKSSVHLQRLDGDAWVSRSHGKDEVGTLVGELVGLNREQFRQVVLLPQGEFATFLRADDDQRREVLGKLFGTHFFRRITDDLQARAQGRGPGGPCGAGAGLGRAGRVGRPVRDLGRAGGGTSACGPGRRRGADRAPRATRPTPLGAGRCPTGGCRAAGEALPGGRCATCCASAVPGGRR
jgi:exonuclease SbcC